MHTRHYRVKLTFSRDGCLRTAQFLSAYCALSCCKVWKKHRLDPEIKVCIVLGHSWAKIAHLARIFRKFLLIKFYLLIVPYHVAKFEKNPLSWFWDTKCIILGLNQAKIAPLTKKGFFWKILVKWFLSADCALSWSKVWTKSLAVILWYKHA